MKSEEATLARMMRAAQTGDKRAYAVLLSESSAWLARYYRRRVPAPQIDDLVQEVLMAVHAKRASYDPARPFLPWLAAIARYRWVDHLRKVYRADETELFDDSAVQDSEEDVVIARVSLERMFGALSDNQATAIELVKIEGHSVRDAAHKSGQSESAIKVNIHRGLKKLSALIEKAE
ncbi:sigma-70 family RNA polymerase sigma factor [Qipengyuania marisflavi]|uniref:Sigma-70 family RNA polymerase sigma factor n=1 Tax=Qipengyuania marisflavi TaxID=2486356 RepID=A0A5S3PUM4_9SPHN|nr:sigma-70 family RNA polymerase sigma factor [Qipengyuania marisflavi]TMM47277.1 sigma-70 family RNA polymerase sigma factor [Qipengyuania marisflavi]